LDPEAIPSRTWKRTQEPRSSSEEKEALKREKLGEKMVNPCLVKMNHFMLMLQPLILKLSRELSTRSRRSFSKEWRSLRDPMS